MDTQTDESLRANFGAVAAASRRTLWGPSPRHAFLIGGLIFAVTQTAALSSAAAAPTASRPFVITDYGQICDDVLANTAIVQRAIDACSAAGSGQVVVPGGTTATVATIELHSHTELHLERGA